jgi:hypothetical protein
MMLLTDAAAAMLLRGVGIEDFSPNELLAPP